MEIVKNRRLVLGFLLLIFLFSCGKKEKISYVLEPREGLTFFVKVLEQETGEALRFYRFYLDEDKEEWIILSPRGCYDASPGGASHIQVKTGKEIFCLDQFSEPLFRPDLISSLLNNDKNFQMEVLPDLAFILQEKKAPLLSASLAGETLKISVKDQGGGAGRLVLFSRDSNGEDIPRALYDTSAFVQRTYKEKGRSIYELELPLPPKQGTRGYAISVFNADGTMESERLFIETSLNRKPESLAEKKPKLHVINDLDESTDALNTFLSQQEEGSLYSQVLFYNSLSGHLVINTPSTEEDVFILCLPEPALNMAGDFVFPVLEQGDSQRPFGKWELLEYLFKFNPQQGLVLIPPSPSLTETQARTGFARIQKWLSLALTMIPLEAVLDAASLSPINGQYLSAGDFVSFVQEQGHVLASLPQKDFPLLDRWLGFGEIRMQTLASGQVIIDDYDKNPSSLVFGETLIRKVPAGRYSVSMIYRNGRRETKTAMVEDQAFSWVIFNYIPDLSAGDFQGTLPTFGVSIAELNPRNYQRIDAPVLLNMGMEQHYISLLEGNKFYEAGDFDKAIAEYTKAIGLKQDYADAYAWRGNAYRKKWDLTRAIDDYTRALNFKNNYPEVYNYRGFLYSQRGDYERAISDYTQAIRQNTNYTDALFNRAFAYGKKEDYEKAIDDYTRVLSLENANAAAYLERGRAWDRRGNTEKAEADYAAAEKLKSR